MSKTIPKHSISSMCDDSKKLREQALFASRQAQTGAARAQQLSRNLADLDLEGLFRQLRQLVDIVGGDSRQVQTPKPTRVSRTPVPMAAE